MTAALAALIALWLAGCKVGPDYQRPLALGTNAMPAAFTPPDGGTNGTEWKPAAPAAGELGGSWCISSAMRR
jgi:hypothetical protein